MTLLVYRYSSVIPRLMGICIKSTKAVTYNNKWQLQDSPELTTPGCLLIQTTSPLMLSLSWQHPRAT